ncbi:MAG: metal ABC transporter solute-binding protein, Zn/Mn family, partial [archaeon]
MFMVGCNQNPKINENNKLNVIVSIIPQKTFLKEIGGKLINVNELIPPGGSPSTYDPKPSEIGLIEKSD